MTTFEVETSYYDQEDHETDYIMGATGDGTSAVVDYIDYTGADGYNWVKNKSIKGVVVKFGTNMRDDP